VPLVKYPGITASIFQLSREGHGAGRLLVGSIKCLGCSLIGPGCNISRFWPSGQFDADISLQSGLSIPLSRRHESPVQIINRAGSLSW